MLAGIGCRTGFARGKGIPNVDEEASKERLENFESQICRQCYGTGHRNQSQTKATVFGIPYIRAIMDSKIK